MNRYAIWDKQSTIITPVGEVLTAAQWKERYPVANIEGVTVVCAAGQINGGFFSTLAHMKQLWEARGVDFSECATDEDVLELVEQSEDAANAPSAPSAEPTFEERTAAALEYANVLNSPDAET